MYAIVIGQCSLSLQSEIKGDAKYISNFFDVIGMINRAKKITAGLNTKSNTAITLDLFQPKMSCSLSFSGM